MRKITLTGTVLAAVAAISVAGYGVYTVVQRADGQQGSGMMGQGMMAQPQDATGAAVFRDDCSLCHTVIAAQGDGIGPNLHGLFGRRSGSHEGFEYSPALSGAGIMWNVKTLDQYLADPAGMVPGNKMAFVGIKDERQRHALIAYLEKATK